MSMVRFLGLLGFSPNVGPYLHDLRHFSSRLGDFFGDMNGAIGATVGVPTQWVNEGEHSKCLNDVHGISKPYHPRCPRPPATGT